MKKINYKELYGIKVGQTVYSNIRSACPNTESNKLVEKEIIKIGHKFITCVDRSTTAESKYHLDDLKEWTDYGYASQLYLTKQSFEEEVEKVKLVRYFVDLFSLGGMKSELTLKTLRDLRGVIRVSEESTKCQ